MLISYSLEYLELNSQDRTIHKTPLGWQRLHSCELGVTCRESPKSRNVSKELVGKLLLTTVHTAYT